MFSHVYITQTLCIPPWNVPDVQEGLHHGTPSCVENSLGSERSELATFDEIYLLFTRQAGAGGRRKGALHETDGFQTGKGWRRRGFMRERHRAQKGQGQGLAGAGDG